MGHTCDDGIRLCIVLLLHSWIDRDSKVKTINYLAAINSLLTSSVQYGT